MTSEERSLERRTLRRQQLLDAAYEVLVNKGVARTTVSDITDYSGVSKGTFYLYFKTKEEIIGALWSRFVDQFSERTNEIVELAPAIGWWQVVDRLIVDMIDYDLEHSDMHRLVATASREGAIHYFSDADNTIVKFVTYTIRQGIASGEFSVSDPELAAEFLYHGADQILLNRALLQQEVDRDRLVAGVKELVYKVLGP